MSAPRGVSAPGGGFWGVSAPGCVCSEGGRVSAPGGLLCPLPRETATAVDVTHPT